MRFMRRVCLASGLASLLGLVLMADLTQPASAQSVRDDRIRASLLGQQEFIETVAEITPELLRLQKELVEKRDAALNLAKRALESGAGPRDFSDIEQSYYRELETLEVMTARARNKSISGKEILRIKVKVRSKAVDSLKEYVSALRRESENGFVGTDAVVAAEANALRAEVVLTAMMQAAGE
jgi:hypothetical protein